MSDCGWESMLVSSPCRVCREANARASPHSVFDGKGLGTKPIVFAKTKAEFQASALIIGTASPLLLLYASIAYGMWVKRIVE